MTIEEFLAEHPRVVNLYSSHLDPGALHVVCRKPGSDELVTCLVPTRQIVEHLNLAMEVLRD